MLGPNFTTAETCAGIGVPAGTGGTVHQSLPLGGITVTALAAIILYRFGKVSVNAGSWHELAVTGEPVEVCCGLLSGRTSLQRKTDLERRRVRPGSGLQTLGRDETGLRI